ncbi:MAG TPA: hypothetical protein VE287_09105 [Actinopolymorphaceae bacterium]|nr:hypothetical protein [Actinopolymorphaceae bacterium]
MAGPSQACILDEAGATSRSPVDDDWPVLMEDGLASMGDSGGAVEGHAALDGAAAVGAPVALDSAATVDSAAAVEGPTAGGPARRTTVGRTAAGRTTVRRTAVDRAAVLDELRAELAARPATATAPRAVPTIPALPAFADLLPERGLRRGASYAVQGSGTLTMALLAGASRSGSWCGLVGMPGFGAEAAAGMGIDLARLVLVPAPGRHWLNVVATLVDVLDLVVVRPPSKAYDAEARRLAARVRERGAVLVVQAREWSGCELRFAITSSTWHGLGAGHGHLTAREVTVEATGRGAGGRRRTTRMWLPDRDGAIRPAEVEAEVGTGQAATVLEFAAPQQWERAG